MKSYLAFLRKEILEIVRNGKLIIFGVIFFVFGITNPMIAKLTPGLYELLEEDFAQQMLQKEAENKKEKDELSQIFDARMNQIREEARKQIERIDRE